MSDYNRIHSKLRQAMRGIEGMARRASQNDPRAVNDYQNLSSALEAISDLAMKVEQLEQQYKEFH